MPSPTRRPSASPSVDLDRAIRQYWARRPRPSRSPSAELDRGPVQPDAAREEVPS